MSLDIIFLRSVTAIGSMPAKGSSKSMNLGSEARALAISVLLLSPPESFIPFVSEKESSLNSLSKFIIFEFIVSLSRDMFCCKAAKTFS